MLSFTTATQSSGSLGPRVCILHNPGSPLATAPDPVLSPAAKLPHVPITKAAPVPVAVVNAANSVQSSMPLLFQLLMLLLPQLLLPVLLLFLPQSSSSGWAPAAEVGGAAPLVSGRAGASSLQTDLASYSRTCGGMTKKPSFGFWPSPPSSPASWMTPSRLFWLSWKTTFLRWC